MNETTETVIELWKFVAGIVTVVVTALVAFFALKSNVKTIEVRLKAAEIGIDRLTSKLDDELQIQHRERVKLHETLAILINDIKHIRERVDEIRG